VNPNIRLEKLFNFFMIFELSNFKNVISALLLILMFFKKYYINTNPELNCTWVQADNINCGCVTADLVYATRR